MKFREANQEEKKELYSHVLETLRALEELSPAYRVARKKLIERDGPTTFEKFCETCIVTVCDITEDYRIFCLFHAMLPDKDYPTLVHSVCSRVVYNAGKMTTLAPNEFITDALLSASTNKSDKFDFLLLGNNGNIAKA